MNSMKMSLAGFGALLLAGSALAQGSTLGLRGHNTKAPINWAADRIEVQDRANRVILSGNVVAEQADLTLNAGRVTVAYTRGDDVDVERIDASGGVVVNSSTDNIRGSIAIYDLQEGIITMLGNVVLRRKEGNIQGGRLVLDLDTGRAVMDGAPGSVPGRTGRVSGTFTVPNKN